MKALFFISAIFISQFAIGQQREIDSLKNLLKTDKKDTTKLIHLYCISDLSETIGNYPDGIKYGNKTISFANVLIKNNNSKNILLMLRKYKAKAYNIIGIVYHRQGNYPEALTNYFASLKLFEELGHKKGIAGSYGNLGNLYTEQGNYPAALKNYFTSLNIAKELNDKFGIANCYHQIGTICFNQNNFPEALKNYFASMKMFEAIDFKLGVAAVYADIGSTYHHQGNYSDAFKNLFVSLKIFESIGDKYGMASTYLALGETKLKLKNTAEAKKYIENALILSKEIGFKMRIRDVYFFLAQVDSTMGNYKSQIEHYKLYILYRDSLDNEETRKKTIQSQMTYDFEKKEAIAAAEHKSELKNQAKIADEKNRKQKLVTYFVVGGLFLVFVFAVFVFRSLKITKKQKAQIEMQKMVVEQHQKEIIDSIKYAKRIQVALLPSGKNIEKNINRLMKD